MRWVVGLLTLLPVLAAEPTCRQRVLTQHPRLEVYQGRNRYEPWCRFLNECDELASALLDTALACKDTVPEGGKEKLVGTDFCDAQDRSCAHAVKSFFNVTLGGNYGATAWAGLAQAFPRLAYGVPLNASAAATLNVSVSSTTQKKVRDALVGAAQVPYGPGVLGGGVGRRIQMSFLPDFDFARRMALLLHNVNSRTDDKVRTCMAKANVSEDELHLPMPLAKITGNGTIFSYKRLKEKECTESLVTWMEGRLMHYSGMEYAKEEWDGGTRAGLIIALSVAGGNLLLIALCAGCCCVCVRRGYCYKLCDGEGEERENLADEANKATVEMTEMEGGTPAPSSA